jgi:hypothetical protein
MALSMRSTVLSLLLAGLVVAEPGVGSTREEWASGGMLASDFERFDRDRDGVLDQKEHARWARADREKEFLEASDDEGKANVHAKAKANVKANAKKAKAKAKDKAKDNKAQARQQKSAPQATAPQTTAPATELQQSIWVLGHEFSRDAFRNAVWCAILASLALGAKLVGHTSVPSAKKLEQDLARRRGHDIKREEAHKKLLEQASLNAKAAPKRRQARVATAVGDDVLAGIYDNQPKPTPQPRRSKQAKAAESASSAESGEAKRAEALRLRQLRVPVGGASRAAGGSSEQEEREDELDQATRPEGHAQEAAEGMGAARPKGQGAAETTAAKATPPVRAAARALWMASGPGTDVESNIHLHRQQEMRQLRASAEAEREAERVLEREIRAQQDSEYEEAKLMDQLRKEEERRQEAEDAEMVGLILAQEAEEAQRRAEAEAELERRRAALPDEPPAAGGAGAGAKADAAAVCSLAFRLPDGSRIQRRFRAAAPLAGVLEFLDLEPAVRALVKPGRWQLGNSYPRVMLAGEEKARATLTELGLAPSAMLVVYDLDK